MAYESGSLSNYRLIFTKCYSKISFDMEEGEKSDREKAGFEDY